MYKPNDEVIVYEILPNKREKRIGSLSAEEAKTSMYLDKRYYVLRCPYCGAKMHFCLGPHKPHFSASKLEGHRKDCDRNHHKSEEQLKNEKIKRKQERELRREIEQENSLADIMKRATRHDSWLQDNDSSASSLQKEFDANGLEKQKEYRTTKTLFDGSVGSYKTPTCLVDYYIQYRAYCNLSYLAPKENGRQFSDILFVSETKQFFRKELDVFGKRVIVLASYIEKERDLKIRTAIEQNVEVVSSINPENLDYRLLEDPFSTSFLSFNTDGTENYKNWEKVVFCLLFKNKREIKLLDEHFSCPGDPNSTRKKMNRNIKLVHVVLCDWGKECDFIDIEGHKRRIVSGVVLDFERQVNVLSDDIFNVFENERVVLGNQYIFV